MTRATLYVLLPLAIATGLWQVSMGTPQTLEASATVQTLEGQPQTLALGPVASQLAIKQLGTNGGGFYNANAAHPYENPSPLSNALTIWQMLVVSTALVFAFGRSSATAAGRGDPLGDGALARFCDGDLLLGRKRRHAGSGGGRPRTPGGNMEGKEVRFGLAAFRLLSPPRRPACRTAPSTPCTAPSRRSAAWCRWC